VVILTVVSSTASTFSGERTPDHIHEKPLPMSIMRWTEYFTSDAVTWSPLWNVASPLRLNVYVRPSSETE